MCMYMRADGTVRERPVKVSLTLALSLSLTLSLMNYQCFKVIGMQRPDSCVCVPADTQTSILKTPNLGGSCVLLMEALTCILILSGQRKFKY